MSVSETSHKPGQARPVSPPRIIAVNMLAITDAGDTFTFREISGRLVKAGFEQEPQLDAPSVAAADPGNQASIRPSPLIVPGVGIDFRYEEPSMRLARASLAMSMLASIMIGAAGTAFPAPPFWGKLAPGPYAVGFRSLWQLDYSRVYNTVFDDKTTYAAGKAPRPILVNIWYPAEPSDDITPMQHGDYLKIQTEDPRLARFADKLIDFERGIVCKEIMRKTVAMLTDDERARFERFWETPTACRRGAPPLDARFPLVLYHSGAQGSFEENSVFCEFLASHGYVVMGSAFQEVTGQTLAVDGRDGSTRDFDFLIRMPAGSRTLSGVASAWWDIAWAPRRS